MLWKATKKCRFFCAKCAYFWVLLHSDRNSAQEQIKCAFATNLTMFACMAAFAGI